MFSFPRYVLGDLGPKKYRAFWFLAGNDHDLLKILEHNVHGWGYALAVHGKRNHRFTVDRAPVAGLTPDREKLVQRKVSRRIRLDMNLPRGVMSMDWRQPTRAILVKRMILPEARAYSDLGGHRHGPKRV